MSYTGLEKQANGRPSNGPGRDSRLAGTEYGSRTTAKSKVPWYLKLAIIMGGVLMVASVGTLGLVYGLSNRYDSKTTHEDILSDVPRNEIKLPEGPLNYLVLGTDTRDTANMTNTSSKDARSDTILLVHIAKGLKSAFVVSLPRDSYVDIPAGGTWKGGKNKINAAYSFGGANLTAKTVYNLSNIPLDGAMIINFAGVQNMVDAVGGVNVCVPYDVPNWFKDFPQYKKGWSKGCHDMKGEEAVVFARQRHDVPGGDFGRMKQQQLVMKALAEKATTAGVLTNPGKLDALLSTAAESLTIDKSMNLRDLAFALKGISPSNINFATAPYKGTMTTPAGSSVELDMPNCQALFQALINDTTTEWMAAHPQPEIPSYGPNG